MAGALVLGSHGATGAFGFGGGAACAPATCSPQAEAMPSPAAPMSPSACRRSNCLTSFFSRFVINVLSVASPCRKCRRRFDGLSESHRRPARGAGADPLVAGVREPGDEVGLELR